MGSTWQDFELRLSRFAPEARLLRSWELKGGISATMTALEFERTPQQLDRVVVRELKWGDLAARQQALEREFKTLQAIVAFGLPAPRPYCIDDTGNQGEPALLLEHVEALPDFAPASVCEATREMAHTLWQIHQVSGAEPVLGFLPRRASSTTTHLANPAAPLDLSLGEDRIRDALVAAGPWPLGNGDVLLHGDYWPGNILWRGARIACVVDWEESEVGDPLADLAIARLDVLFAFGRDAMRTFTRQYQACADIDYRALPYWDLMAALRPMGNIARWAAAYCEPPINRPDINEATLRAAHGVFTEEALGSLR